MLRYCLLQYATIKSVQDKSAYAQTVFGLCAGPGQPVHTFDGRTAGVIVPARGPLDFGWDPVFEPSEGAGGKTYAEMEKDEVSRDSHIFSGSLAEYPLI